MICTQFIEMSPLFQNKFVFLQTHLYFFFKISAFMKKIGYKDLQLELEKDLQKKIDKNISAIAHEMDISRNLKFNREKMFYSLIGRAINVDKHYAVKYIIERIRKNLNLKLNIKIFLYQNNFFQISCFPYKSDSKKELLVFVSQHFFNNLEEDEQVGIIGHELSHHLFNHLNYPVRELMNYPFKLETTNDLKSNLINWSKTSEITSDIIGLIANDFNSKAYSTAIIKHNTGLNDSSTSSFNVSPLVFTALEQYESIANDPLFNEVLSTHPIMPLRVKIINTITKTKLMKNFGESVSMLDFRKFKTDYNELINKTIKGIYPEIFPDIVGYHNIYIPMALAVVLSDGDIKKGEIKALQRIFSKSNSKKIDQYKKVIFTDFIKDENIQYNILIKKFIKESVAFAKKKKYNKHQLVPIIRMLLLIAASDENIDKQELDCIYDFAKEFDFSRSDIVLILNTQ